MSITFLLALADSLEQKAAQFERMGNVGMARQNYEQAAAKYEEAARIDPTQCQAHLDKAQACRTKAGAVTPPTPKQPAAPGKPGTPAKPNTPVSQTGSTEEGKKAPASNDDEGMSLEEAMEALNNLTGLDVIKQRVQEYVNRMKVLQMRRAAGLPETAQNHHMIFTGNPGTGKTTVARLMGHIFRGLEVVTRGHLVECAAEDLVAGYVGQTAMKAKEKMEEAQGGVLFIDEAYILADNGDFGKQAIATIIKQMEDNRGDLVVIFAGYAKEMTEFMNTNSGIKSRVMIMDFPDYNGAELYSIFERLCKKDKFIVDPVAEQRIRQYFLNMYANRDANFGNGRDVRNTYEAIVSRQFTRLASLTTPASETDLRTILPCDLPC